MTKEQYWSIAGIDLGLLIVGCLFLFFPFTGLTSSGLIAVKFIGWFIGFFGLTYPLVVAFQYDNERGGMKTGFSFLFSGLLILFMELGFQYGILTYISTSIGGWVTLFYIYPFLLAPAACLLCRYKDDNVWDDWTFILLFLGSPIFAFLIPILVVIILVIAIFGS